MFRTGNKNDSDSIGNTPIFIELLLRYEDYVFVGSYLPLFGVGGKRISRTTKLTSFRSELPMSGELYPGNLDRLPFANLAHVGRQNIHWFSSDPYNLQNCMTLGNKGLLQGLIFLQGHSAIAMQNSIRPMLLSSNIVGVALIGHLKITGTFRKSVFGHYSTHGCSCR